ncbi:MAG TPA: GNAT family N-acetyltransferase [Dongiaceae bacterium]|nr:GNAT family N-acetyltransferase [Dongiaceae bacterium]
MAVAIETLTAADADAVAAMSYRFHIYLRGLGDSDPYRFGRERYLADGFGDDPAFGGFMALLDRVPAGYLLHCPSYDVDLALRQLMVIDLWVEPETRGHGIGRKLMLAAAEHAKARGARRLIWAVYRGNQLAVDFYRRLGAADVEALDWMTLSLDGASLEA